MTRRACVLTPLALWALPAVPAWAHVVSMSAGDLTVAGARAHYELRMPLYELAHVFKPETTLLAHIRFSSGGRDARLAAHACSSDAARALYVCTAEYDFAATVDHLDVECTFPAVVAPTHVHVLRAQLGTGSGGRQDQAVFDQAFERATLRFRPPTAAEIATAEFCAGGLRALAGVVQIVFLAALGVAARSPRERWALAAMFLAGQTAAVLAVPHTAWDPAPRFVEAAAALTVAYLAVEVLLLPKAGARWLVAGVLGAFHGLFFHLYLRNTGYRPGFVLAGAAVVDVLAIAFFGWGFAKVARVAKRFNPVPVAASAMFVFGMAWFALRLRG
jgi:hypothetical protein